MGGDVIALQISNKNALKLGLIIISLLFVFILLLFYPRVGNTFDYWHSCTAIIVDNEGKINLNQVDSGFYISSVIVNKICNIKYDIIPTTPIIIIAYILMTLVLLRNMVNNKNYLLVAILIVIVDVMKNDGGIYFWVHAVGWIIVLFMFCLLSIILKNRNINKISIYILLILSILSVNIMSYKMTFLALSLLISFQLVEIFESKFYNKKYINFIYLIIFGIVYVLITNEFFYNEFLPRLVIQSDIYGTGLEKFFLSIGQVSINPLAPYAYRSPSYVIYMNTAWSVLTLIGLIAFIIFTLYNSMKKNAMKIYEKLLIAMSLASVIIILIYNVLGLLQVGYFLAIGLWFYAPLYCQINSKYLKAGIICILLILLILGTGIYLSKYTSGYYDGLKNYNNFAYINPSEKWFEKHVNYMTAQEDKYNENQNKIRLYSDVFTIGYYEKEFYSNDLASTYSQLINSNQLLSLITNNSSIQIQPNSMYLINNKLNNFVIENWFTVSSWKNYKNIMESNKNYIIVYNSGDIELVVS